MNLGTAGTFLHNVGDIFVATYFIDKDYEAVKLPRVEYQIDGKLFIKITPRLTNWLSEYQKVGICSTGDTFVTETISLSGSFVDIETYTQAYVCKEQSIPFLSVKYITDVVGENSVEHWKNKLANAHEALTL